MLIGANEKLRMLIIYNKKLKEGMRWEGIGAK
jgi:hypothetical protein